MIGRVVVVVVVVVVVKVVLTLVVDTVVPVTFSSARTYTHHMVRCIDACLTPQHHRLRLSHSSIHM